MAELKAFKALLYSKKIENEFHELLSPPYDVLDSKDRQSLIDKNKLNSVQLCLAEDPSDPECYEKMKKRFEEWKEKGVLQRVEKPAFYLIEDRFEIAGEQKKRVGFVGLLKTSPFEDKEVLPHEHTLKGPKKDRLALLETMGAELSQIFMCYQDDSLTLEKIYDKYSDQKAYLDTTDCLGVHRRLWIVDDNSEIDAISKMMRSKPALIADGHHRYETALEFARRHPDKGAYVQVYFTNQLSPGFGILPIHRMTELPESFSKDDFLGKLRAEYQLQECSRDKLEAEVSAVKGSELRIALVLSKDSNAFILSKPKSTEHDAEIFFLQKNIFEEIFGWKIEDVSKDKVSFDHRVKTIFDKVDAGSRNIGFILPPTDLNLVMEISQKGERMPQKSTFFYPKLASGLVNYELG